MKANDLIKVTNLAETAKAAVEAVAELAPLEGLEGWYISSYTAEDAGIDCIVLACDAGAAVNPLHSGGDANWLGYMAEGSLELTLGDESGKQDSSRKVNQGDFLTFAPETFHGWIPGDVPAKLLFLKLS